MPEKNEGLFEKYSVSRLDGKAMGPAFVLEYERDPFAIAALKAYADSIKAYPAFSGLAVDLMRIVDKAYMNGVRCRLDCPQCGVKHVDENEWATRRHRRHQCQSCGHEWMPFDFFTFGVEK